MAKFFDLPEWLRLMVSFFLSIMVISQTACFILGWYRHPKRQNQQLENVLELAILGQFLVLNGVQGKLVQGYFMGIVPVVSLPVWRYGFAVFVGVLSVTVAWQSRKPKYLVIVPLTLLTLPWMEPYLGSTYPYWYTGALVFWLLRSVGIGKRRYIELQKNLSAFSVKDTLDSLETGILFYEPKGYVVLSNHKMLDLMANFTGKYWRNGVLFHDVISNLEGAQFQDDQWIVKGDNGSVWLFSRAMIEIDHVEMYRLTASDVTNHWKLMSRLNEKNQQLSQMSTALKASIANIHHLSRNQALKETRIRTHDILGQLIALYVSVLRKDTLGAEHRLVGRSKALLEGFLSGKVSQRPCEEEFESLKRTFKLLGVDVVYEGYFPDRSREGDVLVEIARECITNAIRHGFASQISILGRVEGPDYIMTVSNNGDIPSGPIVEGGGLSGIQAQLETFNGVMTVEHTQEFTICVRFPRR